MYIPLFWRKRMEMEMDEMDECFRENGDFHCHHLYWVIRRNRETKISWNSPYTILEAPIRNNKITAVQCFTWSDGFFPILRQNSIKSYQLYDYGLCLRFSVLRWASKGRLASESLVAVLYFIIRELSCLQDKYSGAVCIICRSNNSKSASELVVWIAVWAFVSEKPDK